MSGRRPVWLLLLAAAAAPPAPAHADCSRAFERDGVVYWDDGPEIRRFELSTGAPVAPIPLADPSGIYRLAADGGVVWIQRFGALDALDLAGNVVRQIPVDYTVVDLDAADGHVFVLGTTDLYSYDAATGALEDTIPVPPIDYGGLVAVPGSRVVLHAEQWLQTVSYAPDGELGAIAPVYSQGTFATQSLERSAGGRLIADGAFFDAATLRLVEGHGGDLAIAVGAELVTLDVYIDFPATPAATIRRYDAARNLVGMEAYAGGSRYAAFFSDGSALWGLDCSGGEATGHLARIELDDIDPPVSPAPIPEAGFENGIQFGFQTGDDGILYFLAYDEPHVRRWLPAEDRFLASLPLPERPGGLSRATGGGVYVHYANGRTTRLATDGTESAVPRFPRGAIGVAPLVEAPPWWILNDALSLHVFDADGNWRDVYHDFGGTVHAVWDAPRSRVIRISGATSVAGTLDVAPDGSITPGPDGPVDLFYPLIASGEDRIFARDRIVDAETLAVVADLPHAVAGERLAMWHGGDRLLTLTVDDFGATRYSEFTADGIWGSSVELPGVPEAVLPLGERALLVRRTAGTSQFVFTVVTPGGDLDSDGAPDAADDFPIDPAEHSDRDGDGIGDNADLFPDDPNESSDADGDGLGDGTDWLPGYAAVRVARVTGEDWVSVTGFRRAKRSLDGQLHLLESGVFAFCRAPGICLPGAWRETASARRIDLRILPDFLTGFGESLELELAQAVDRNVRLRFQARLARGRVRAADDGTVRFTIRAPHRGSIAGIGPFVGAYRIRTSGEWLELTPAGP
jgi:hypothetical protein